MVSVLVEQGTIKGMSTVSIDINDGGNSDVGNLLHMERAHKPRIVNLTTSQDPVLSQTICDPKLSTRTSTDTISSCALSMEPTTGIFSR